MDAKVLNFGQISKCPKRSLLPRHFKADGTCRCADRHEVMLELEDAQTRLRKAQRDVQYWKNELEKC